MNPKLITVAAALVISPVMAEPSRSDGGCPPGPSIYDDHFAKGKAAEAAGKTLDAVLYFRAAEGCVPPARDALGRIGKKQGAAAEKAGRLERGEGIFRTVPDAPCRKWLELVGEGMPPEPGPPGVCAGDGRRTINSGASAIDWYEETGNFAETDRVLLIVAGRPATDPKKLETIVDHFNGRRDNPPVESYRVDPKQFDTLRAIARKRGDEAFAREAAEYDRKEMDPATGGGPEDRSLAALSRTRQWYSVFEDNSEAKVVQRAVERGDALARDEKVPASLQQAIAYYEFAGRGDKAQAVRATANRLGTEAQKRGDRMNASQYFGIAGNQKAVRETGAGAAADAQRELKSMGIGDDARKKKFKKEQDDLEKELGL